VERPPLKPTPRLQSTIPAAFELMNHDDEFFAGDDSVLKTFDLNHDLYTKFYQELAVWSACTIGWVCCLPLCLPFELCNIRDYSRARHVAITRDGIRYGRTRGRRRLTALPRRRPRRRRTASRLAFVWPRARRGRTARSKGKPVPTLHPPASCARSRAFPLAPRYVVDKHPSGARCSCFDVGRVSKTIPFDKITDCDVEEPAGAAFCCCVTNVLHKVVADTASSRGAGSPEEGPRHDLVIEGLQEPHQFKKDGERTPLPPCLPPSHPCMPHRSRRTVSAPLSSLVSLCMPHQFKRDGERPPLPSLVSCPSLPLALALAQRGDATRASHAPAGRRRGGGSRSSLSPIVPAAPTPSPSPPFPFPSSSLSLSVLVPSPSTSAHALPMPHG
jgi:hypothetical protein